MRGDGDSTVVLPGDAAGESVPGAASPGPHADGTTPDAQELIVPPTIGRYVVSGTIARGGMGVIAKAWDELFSRHVAIKLLAAQNHRAAAVRQRFQFEARITAQLQHPGVVPVYDTGVTTDDRPYFVMKLIEGVSLKAQLRHAPAHKLKHLRVFESVCQTLAYCHSHGVVHLDIKPANVMVGAFGEVHIVDWGLAQTVALDPASPLGSGWLRLSPGEGGEAEPPAARPIHGTPAYMSPEQAAGERVSVRTDVFGLGAMLCEILIGRPPRGSGLRETGSPDAQGTLVASLAMLQATKEHLPMVRLAERCLSADPARRPENARVVASAASAYLETLLLDGTKDLHRFFELSLDLFCIASIDGHFLRTNGNFSKVLGHPESELVSRPFLDFVHPDDRASTVAAMSALASGDPVIRFRNRYRAADGSHRTFEWTAKSIPAESIVFAVARDVTPPEETGAQDG